MYQKHIMIEHLEKEKKGSKMRQQAAGSRQQAAGTNHPLSLSLSLSLFSSSLY
jgi:hypothetical protein